MRESKRAIAHLPCSPNTELLLVAGQFETAFQELRLGADCPGPISTHVPLTNGTSPHEPAASEYALQPLVVVHIPPSVSGSPSGQRALV